MITAVKEITAESKIEQLLALRSFRSEAIDALRALLHAADEGVLFRINPLQFAEEHKLDQDEAVELFLNAAHVGLFRLEWGLVCPCCGNVVESVASLETVHRHYTCGLCHKEYETILDDFVEVSFTVAPPVRAIRFHHPERLSIHDLFFRYSFTRAARSARGARLIHLFRRATRALTYVAPGAKAAYRFMISPGLLIAYEHSAGGGAMVFAVEPPAAPEPQTLTLRRDEEGCAPTGGALRAGELRLQLENAGSRRGAFLVMNLPRELLPLNTEFAPFLTARRVLTSQTFRNLFRAEVVGSEGLAIRSLAVLFTDIRGSTELYARVGDLNAFSIVRQHFTHLTEAIQRHRGALVKTIGDAVMASFSSPADALAAARDFTERLRGFNRAYGEDVLVLKMGLHSGPAIAVTLNNSTDYFGQTVNLAARLQRIAAEDEICLSEDIYARGDVQALVAELPSIQQPVWPKGIQRPLQVRRVRLTPAAA